MKRSHRLSPSILRGTLVIAVATVANIGCTATASAAVSTYFSFKDTTPEDQRVPYSTNDLAQGIVPGINDNNKDHERGSYAGWTDAASATEPGQSNRMWYYASQDPTYTLDLGAGPNGRGYDLSGYNIFVGSFSTTPDKKFTLKLQVSTIDEPSTFIDVMTISQTDELRWEQVINGYKVSFDANDPVHNIEKIRWIVTDVTHFEEPTIQEFDLFGTPSATTIPEPSSLSVLGLSGFLMMRHRGRKSR